LSIQRPIRINYLTGPIRCIWQWYSLPNVGETAGLQMELKTLTKKRFFYQIAEVWQEGKRWKHSLDSELSFSTSVEAMESAEEYFLMQKNNE